MKKPVLYRDGVSTRETGRKGVPRSGPASRYFDPDVPEPGFYRTRIAKGAVDSVISIWLGPARDPDDGSELERPWAWQATVNGAPIPVSNVWPGCARDPISKEEHDRICERNRTMDEASPYYDARKKLDIGKAPPPF